MKLFSSIGVEPTFYPDVQLPSFFLRTESKWERVFSAMNECITSTWWQSLQGRLARHQFTWLKGIHEDDRVIEVNTQKQYDDYAELEADYKRLLKFMKTEFNYIESSNVCMETEGGCHLNISLNEVRQATTLVEANKYCVELMNFFNLHPYLPWLFLAPNDNGSATFMGDTRWNDTCKGDALNFRNVCSPSYYDFDNPTKVYTLTSESYLEHRYFMQPRSVREFRYHVEVANAVMFYVAMRFLENRPFRNNNTKAKIQRITYKEAETKVKHLLDEIGVEWQVAKDLGKFDLLKQRYRYHQTKHNKETNFLN